MLTRIIEKTIERVKGIKDLKPSSRFPQFLPAPPLFITEIKRKSPSRGVISEDMNILEKVQKYIEGGANLISVVTEPFFFGGNIRDIETIKNNFKIGVLRKDFIISKEQVIESQNAGADGILLISRILDNDKLKELIKLSRTLCLFALVECHSAYDIERSLKAGAEIIGINSRDLNTFEIDLTLFKKLRIYIPNNVIKIAESGIQNLGTIKEIKSFGYDGFLVGTRLMFEKNPEKIIREWVKEWKK